MQLDALAEFETPEALLRATVALSEAGGVVLESFTPFPMQAVEDAIGHPRSRIPLYVLGAGLGGAIYAFLFQWWANGFDYPLNVGGRPLFSAPAFIPITFEGGVLAASLTSFLALLGFCGLPRLWHPVFEVDGFERVSIDRFFLRVQGAPGGTFDVRQVEEMLVGCGALRIHDMRRIGS